MSDKLNIAAILDNARRLIAKPDAAVIELPHAAPPQPVTADDPRLMAVTNASVRQGIATGRVVTPSGKEYEGEQAIKYVIQGLISEGHLVKNIRALLKDETFKISAMIKALPNPKKFVNVAIAAANEAIRMAKVKKHRELMEAQEEAGVAVGSMPRWPDSVDGAGMMPMSTYRNTRLALIALGLECHKDVFHERSIIGFHKDVKHEIVKHAGDLTDDAYALLRDLVIARYNFDPGKANVEHAVDALCVAHRFNPIWDYLDALKWDGVPRIDTWVTVYLGVPATPLSRAIGRIMLLAAVWRAREPGCKFDEIVVLEGAQGSQKTTALQVLAGEPENFSDQSILDVNDQRAQENCAGVWIYEIADLSGIGRADTNKVKAFASRTVDRARPAYGHARLDKKRCGIFVATTNDDVYLRDQTGNRRFWPLVTGRIDLEALRRDRDQLFAEASVLQAKGSLDDIRLDQSLWAAAAIEQEARREAHPWEDDLCEIPSTIIHAGPDRIGKDARGDSCRIKTQVVASADLLAFLKIERSAKMAWQAMQLSTCMRQVGWHRNKGGKVAIGKRSVNGYWRDAPTPTSDAPTPTSKRDAQESRTKEEMVNAPPF